MSLFNLKALCTLKFFYAKGKVTKVESTGKSVLGSVYFVTYI